jgi:glycosyltransferase involved in cell wall biosynthesis
MKARRVCFVTTFYPPYSFGGDAIDVRRMARGLAARGLDVTVVHDADAFAVAAGTPPPAASDVREASGVRVVTLSSRVPLLSTLLTHQTGRPVVNRRRLRDVLDVDPFDAILFNNVSLVGGPGLFSYGRSAAKIYLAHEHWLVCPTHVLWRHNRELCTGRECLRCQLHYRRPPQIWRHTGLLERAAAEIDLFIAMSEFSRTKHREFGFTREMSILPCFLSDAEASVEPAAGSSPHDRPYFLFVGRLERIKGIEELIDAFETVTDADLLIAGNGTDAGVLRTRAAGNERIRFLGHIDDDRLAQHYRHALALLAPSVCYETFGLTLIEAFGHRTPVIARRLGPFPQLVDTSGGGLTFETREQLLAAIERLRTHPEEREAMGRAGFEAFQQHWSESAVVPRCLELIEEAIARRRARDGR